MVIWWINRKTKNTPDVPFFFELKSQFFESSSIDFTFECKFHTRKNVKMLTVVKWHVNTVGSCQLCYNWVVAFPKRCMIYAERNPRFWKLTVISHCSIPLPMNVQVTKKKLSPFSWKFIDLLRSSRGSTVRNKLQIASLDIYKEVEITMCWCNKYIQLIYLDR